jgi:hypothetical protein
MGMPEMKAFVRLAPSYRVETASAAGASIVIALWLALYVGSLWGGNWTGLFHHGKRIPVPAELDQVHPVLYNSNHGYDGQFYRMAAHDPWATRGFSSYIDAPKFRRQRMLLPVLSWLTAFGREKFIDAAYLFWTVAFCGLGVWWSSRLATRMGQSAFWGLAFLALPGVVLSVHRLLLDGPFLAFSAGAIFYDRERSNGKLWCSLAAACLCREAGVLLIAGIALPRLLNRDWRGVLIVGASVAPLVAWFLWLGTRVASTPGVTAGPTALGFVPLQGLIGRIAYLRPYKSPEPLLTIIRAADIISLLGIGLAILLALVLFAQAPRWTVVSVAAAFAGLAMLLWDPRFVWYDFYAYARGLAPLTACLDLAALERRNWKLALPTLLQYPRLGVEFGRPLQTVLQNLTP